MGSHPSRRALSPLIILLSLLLSLAVAAPAAAKKNPPGNNGTVKVDGLDFDRHPNNEPHVGCRFEIDFYGFDAGVGNAEVIFAAHAPTGNGHLVTKWVDIGEDDNSGGGSEAGWDASVEVNLTEALASYQAHPQQGHHVKLTVHAPGSQGADTKHKVFWVGPCDPAVTPPNNPPENPPSNPPGNPPSNPPSGGVDPDAGPRGGTLGGTPQLLPDTAVDSTVGSLALMAGMFLLGGSATLTAVAVRRTRTTRR
jgi:hypothetical protein